MIDAERVIVIERSIRATCHDLGVVVHAIGMVADHVHVAASIPPRLAVADAVKQMKGESSHLLNHSAGRSAIDWFAWQPEYGVVSFGERSLPDIVAYVENQPAHHAAGTLLPIYETIERPAPDRRRSSPGGTL